MLAQDCQQTTGHLLRCTERWQSPCCSFLNTRKEFKRLTCRRCTMTFLYHRVFFLVTSYGWSISSALSTHPILEFYETTQMGLVTLWPPLLVICCMTSVCMVESIYTTLLLCHLTKRRGPECRGFIGSCWLATSCRTATGAWFSLIVPQHTVFLCTIYRYSLEPVYPWSSRLLIMKATIFSVAVRCVASGDIWSSIWKPGSSLPVYMWNL